MATRQYIGARYVPQIFGEWQQHLSYEALTVVTHAGNSFTSKQPVPAGVDISDTAYWVVTGNYNAQVEEYRQEVEEVREDIDNLGERNFIFIADSYGVTPNLAGGWCNLIVEKYGLQGHSYINALPGSGFSVNEIQGFKNQLSEITVPDANKITDIVVCGGVNDVTGFTDTSALGAGIKAFCDYAKANYPKATVRIGNVGYFEFEKLTCLILILFTTITVSVSIRNLQLLMARFIWMAASVFCISGI